MSGLPRLDYESGDEGCAGSKEPQQNRPAKPLLWCSRSFCFGFGGLWWGGCRLAGCTWTWLSRHVDADIFYMIDFRLLLSHLIGVQARIGEHLCASQQTEIAGEACIHFRLEWSMTRRLVNIRRYLHHSMRPIWFPLVLYPIEISARPVSYTSVMRLTRKITAR